MKLKTIQTGALNEAPWNAHVCDEATLQRIANSVERYGVVENLVVRPLDDPPTKYEVISGNHRLRVYRDLGMKSVACRVVDLDDGDARLLAQVLNNTRGQDDLDKARALYASLPELGITFEEMTALLPDTEPLPPLDPFGDGGDPDDVPEPPDEATTKPGDLWILGEHRLLCGDSADPTDVARLVAGAVIDLVNMDPPYNVRVEPRSNNAIAAGLSSFQNKKAQLHHQGFDKARGAYHPPKPGQKMRAKDRPLENDFVSEEAFDEMLLAWFTNASNVLKPGGSFYIWGGYANLGNYPGPIKAAGLYFSQGVVWDKEHPVLTRKDMMGAFEICFYGWKEGAGHQFYGPNNATDLWHVKKVNPQSMVHLTEKPVELARRAIEYSSKKGENVLDLFGGSGSTLMGAHMTGRRAFLMEMDPAYCDVIVQRFTEATGITAEVEAAKTPPPE